MESERPMNGKKARALRKLAEYEMEEHRLPRELVSGGHRVVNNPESTRAMSRALKTAYKKSQRKSS